MTFNQVVWKMVKYHYKKYLFYLTCNSLAVMFFFIFLTVYLNEQLVAIKYTEGLQSILGIPGAALIIFTVFFITYAHHLFMKKRRSEFGLFMTLGMTNRDIVKLLLLENSAIAVVAVFKGLGMGAVFSKFFFWFLLKSVGIQEISFQLNVKMFIYTIGAFFLVFIVATGQSLYLTMRKNIIQNLKTEKETENTAYKHPAIGGIGVAIIIGSIIGLFVTITDGGDYLLLWAIGTFLGLYIALNQLTSFLITLIKKNKDFYYRNILYLTNMDYKYRQFTTMVTLVTVMIMVTLLYSTIIYSNYTEAGKEAIQNNPFDVSYISTETKNNLTREEVYSVFERHDNNVQEHFSLPIYFIFQRDSYGIHQITFMPLSKYNEFAGESRELETNELIYHLNGTASDLENVFYGYDLHFSINGNDVVYNYEQKIGDLQFNYLGEFFIINDEEFVTLKENIDGLEADFHLLNVENWELSEEAVVELEQAFINYNAQTPALNSLGEFQEEELFSITSRVDSYINRLEGDGIQFFIAIFLNILFSIGSFLLLYVQLFSEVDKDRQRILKLYRIGITSKEVKRLLSQEITTIFMLPTLIGIVIALLYIIALAKDMGGVFANPVILFQFFMIAGIYLIIQFVFLIYAKRKMFVEVGNFKQK